MKNFVLGTLLVLLIIGCTVQQEEGMENDAMEEEVENHQVSIEGFEYIPASITISAGDTVVWTNMDSAEHTVTEDNNIFDSGSMNNDDTYNRTFNEEGTYNYYCTLHPYMKGTIIVE